MLLVWDKRVFEKVDCAVGRFSVNVLFKGAVDDFVWACSGVYGPNEDSQRGALWEELSRMHSRWNTAWCVFGDFNIIRYPSERLGCETLSPAMFAFSDFIEGLHLLDLEIRGQIVCQELIEPWHRWIGWNTLLMCLKGFSLV